MSLESITSIETVISSIFCLNFEAETTSKLSSEEFSFSETFISLF